MKAFLAAIAALTVPLFVLNALGGIVAAIWLAILGQWGAILWGIAGFFFSAWALTFALVPAALLFAPAVICAERGNTPGFILLGILSNLYVAALITIWCVGALLFFARYAVHGGLFPLLIWSYGVATGPWAYMASKESEGGGPALAAFLAELAYLVVIVLVLLVSLTPIGAAKVFASFMLLGVIVQTALAVAIQRESPKGQVADVVDDGEDQDSVS